LSKRSGRESLPDHGSARAHAHPSQGSAVSGRRAREWITPQEAFKAEARKCWSEGDRLHVHVHGDKGIAFVLGVFEELQSENPRLPNSLVMEHCGLSNDELNRRVARLCASVSTNPCNLMALEDTCANVGLGRDRAQRLVSLGGLVERGVTVALHPDFGMAPASPLFLA
jgi:predicted amidohydrolase YtcJ